MSDDRHSAQDHGNDRRWTILEVLEWTAKRFSQHDIPSARLDAEVLLAHCLSVDRLRLYLDYDKPLAPEELAAYRAAIRRRLADEPVAYVIGRREFWSLELQVDRSVLVPRPETELLVEIALETLSARGWPAASVVDVGTGSGAVAIALAHERPELTLYATDISAEALRVARDNAARHDVKISFHQGDLLDALPAKLTLDLVLANLPYIPSGDLPQLMPQVGRWEPRLALDGGDDGLDVIRRLIPQAAQRLQPGGLLALEITSAQRDAVETLLQQAGFEQVATRRDLAGHDRIVIGQRPGA